MEKKYLGDQQQQREEQFRREQPFLRPSSPPPQLPPASRTDRIQQLRLEHQRRHRERHGQYPLDAEEERHIQELERQVLITTIIVIYWDCLQRQSGCR